MAGPMDGLPDRRDDQVEPTRRSLLRTTLVAGAVVLPAGTLLTACTGDSPSGGETPGPTPTPTPTPTPDPDLPTLDAAGESERGLLLAYAATLARHPELKSRLAAHVARHEQHLAALTSAARPTSAPVAPISTASPDASAAARVPGSSSSALAALAGAERAAADDRATDLRTVRAPEHARLLASIGACEATHATVLGGEVA